MQTLKNFKFFDFLMDLFWHNSKTNWPYSYSESGDPCFKDISVTVFMLKLRKAARVWEKLKHAGLRWS